MFYDKTIFISFFMRYYLDVNTLYNLKRVPENLIAVSFTSAFSILEILAGINENNFKRRRACLYNIVQLNLHIDWRLPYAAFHDAFDVFKEFDMIDSKINDLKIAVNDCLMSNSYEEVTNMNLFETFNRIDRKISFGFSTTRSNINEIFQEKVPPIYFQGIEVALDTPHNLRVLYTANWDKYLDYCLDKIVETLQRLINTSKAIDKPQFSSADIKRSYNSSLDVFLTAFSRDLSNLLGVNELPGKNDSQDLYHLAYLTPNLKIVSDDKRFKILVPKLSIGLEEFIS